MRFRPARIAALLVLVTCVGCASNPVETSRRTQGAALAEMQASALTHDQPSVHSRQVLRILDMEHAWKDDPRKAFDDLAALETESVGTLELAVTRSELAYWHADRSNGREAQSLYLQALTTGVRELARTASIGAVLDPRLRLLAEIYNRALARYVEIGQELDGHPKNWKTLHSPYGEIPFTLETGPGRWDPADFDSLVPAEAIDQKGIANEFRRFGVGATMVGIRDNRDGMNRKNRLRPATISEPVTVVLRVLGTDGAQMAFLDPRRVETMKSASGEAIPIAGNFTAPLAHVVGGGDLYTRENPSLFNPAEFNHLTGLYFHAPYDPQKIPVVLVHGLWSSPLTWIWLMNELSGDDFLRDRYQFWYYAYPTGNPLLSNAARFRRELYEVKAAVDPEGDDPAWQNMVLVGHSMGGLLSKFMSKDTGDRLWNHRATRPFDQLKATSEDRETVQRAFFYERVPFVKRVVFVCCPHRGSDMADGIFGAIGSSMITVDPEIESLVERIMRDNPGLIRTDGGLEESVMNSIDHLSADSPFLAEMDAIPFPADLPYHSIIGDEEEAGRVGGSDGVVPYASSNLPGARSELVVHSDHSATGKPATMAEVRRILRLHLRESSGTP